MKYKKVGAIGAMGNVGASFVSVLAKSGICKEITTKDLDIDKMTGISLDIAQMCATEGSPTKVYAAKNPKDFDGCDVVVITAGLPRKPGMSRDDLLLKNASIIKSVIEEIQEYIKDAIIIVVSNPLDAMVYQALKTSGFDKSKVIGMAGVLDSSRMVSFIYEELGFGAGQIIAPVLGGHGDDMVPLSRYTSVGGLPISTFLNQDKIDKIIERTRKGGAEIVGYLKNGSAYYAPGNSAYEMTKAIINDTKQLLPCACLLDGEYGHKNVVCGVPIVLGANGVEKIVELTLNNDEKNMLNNSINSVKKLIETLEKNS